MATKTDFYDVLGVPRSAKADEIKKAYRKLAAKHHPDRNAGDAEAERRFKQAQEAYDVLGDEKKREQYDRFGAAAFEGGGPGGHPFGQQWSGRGGGGPQGMEFDFGGGAGFDDVLSSLFGNRAGGGRSPGGPGGGRSVRGADVEARMEVPFLTAVLGGSQDVTLQAPGSGPQHLEMTVPPAVRDGAKLRLSGKGQPSPTGGPAGDLIVTVQVQPHRWFTREGADVHLELPIGYDEALLGTEAEVPTVDGRLTVTVPPGTSGGQKLRLRGKGGPRGKGSGERGDQFVTVRIVVPKTLDDLGRDLVTQLADRYPADAAAKRPWT